MAPDFHEAVEHSKRSHLVDQARNGPGLPGAWGIFQCRECFETVRNHRIRTETIGLINRPPRGSRQGVERRSSRPSPQEVAISPQIPAPSLPITSRGRNRRVRFGSALRSITWSLGAHAKSESMSLPAVTSPGLLPSQLRRRANPGTSIFLRLPFRSKTQPSEQKLGARLPAERPISGNLAEGFCENGLAVNAGTALESTYA